MTVKIEGPVLLLMGPLGAFFSRLADFLLAHNVPTYKIMFPLREYFPHKKHLVLNYDRPMTEWRAFLLEVVKKHGIRHLFMYGDFVIPHKMAIDLANELGIEAWVFELGYVRPNYVTLERDRANARSNLNLPADFYRNLPDGQQPVKGLPLASRPWRFFKPFCFIQHAFTDYPIVDGPHKLQPNPSYLIFELMGLLKRKYYEFTEREIRVAIRKAPSLFLVALQVSIDSQLTMSSTYQGVEGFIAQVLDSFVRCAEEGQHVVFKHHPRDRGYNNYKAFIARESQRLGVARRVHYIHDDKLVNLITHCKGVITINSTVGLTSLRYSIPTKVMGRTFYDLPGLTTQGSLDEFWKKQDEVDRALYIKFYNYMVEQTQITGNFDGYFPFAETFRFPQPGA